MTAFPTGPLFLGADGEKVAATSGNAGEAFLSGGPGVEGAYGKVDTSGLADDAVTYAKIQNVSATSRVLGRKTAGAGDTEELTLSEVLDFVGSAAQGDILYRGASTWTRLAAGTSGDFLKTNGAGANPSWATVSGGAGKWFRTFNPGDNEAPPSNYATPDSRNNRPILEFDTTTQEAAIFSDILGFNYAGGGLTVTIYAAMDTATTGTLGWDVAMERTQASTDDTDSDSFASAVTIIAATVPGTSGQILAMSATLSNGSNMDSTAAGEMFRLRIRRDVANDTAAGDAQVFAVHVREN